KREKGFLRPMSRREGRDPALLLRSGRRWREAPDEGASEASCSCPSRQHQKHASLRSRPLIRPPGTFSRKREKGFLPISRREVRDQPFSCAAGVGLPSQLSPQGSGSALLLRSGRRWRAAPDEGASAASCCCPSQAKIKSTLRCARAPSSALRAPSPVNGRRASSPTLAARFGISP